MFLGGRLTNPVLRISLSDGAEVTCSGRHL